MTELHPVIKKLQFKLQQEPVLVLNAPESYKQEVVPHFPEEVHLNPEKERYPFIQVFGENNEEIARFAKLAVEHLALNGILWLCYPKKSSKKYKGSDASRDSVGSMLSTDGFEPVRQIAIDDDWSALRFRKTDQIKNMKRKFAVTEEGKKRTGRL
ncbi:DUF3052 domain-containing protein [Halalkalibacillus sediminis]|uniref:DUF3052 domain-containing protein n=1 Tax=Halalkalibacillus sediminis TaxID=2018042 RepID=A0A2I0QTL3_9BACI|nr:DUF3052 domain-containing protein [Halalkalibacillus sediminis]PKR77683.1 DUF3052 domain-containing protein [Halalkalibacillus sediminis]